MKRISLAAASLFLSAVSVFGHDPARPRIAYEETPRSRAPMHDATAVREIVDAFSRRHLDATSGLKVYVTTGLEYIGIVPDTHWAWMGKDLLSRRSDLSYRPENPRLTEADQRFLRLIYFYAEPSRASEAEDVFRGFADLYEEKNIGETFDVYQALSGDDLPLYIITFSARSSADYHVTDERVRAALGQSAQALNEKATAVTRRFATGDAYYRPDLSYASLRHRE